MSYWIELQPAKDDLTPIKTVTKTVVEKDGQTEVFSVKFPCLRVVVKSSLDSENSQFEITWSNFYFTHNENPGKFKIKRVSVRHELMYEKDAINGRTIKYYGKPVLDLVKMSKFGTEMLEDGSLSFGPTHPKTKQILWQKEFESVDNFEESLKENFGDLSEEILSLFTSHELYTTFQTVPV